jgi:hypothetical protein
MQRFSVASMALLALAAAAQAPFSAKEIRAIYASAGFKVQGSTIVGCEARHPKGPVSNFSIRAIDLNGDGKAEAIVTETNTACYGRDAQRFTVLAQDAHGNWRKLGYGSGAMRVLKSRQKGWLDIEYGGPGSPSGQLLRWTGKVYL